MRQSRIVSPNQSLFMIVSLIYRVQTTFNRCISKRQSSIVNIFKSPVEALCKNAFIFYSSSRSFSYFPLPTAETTVHGDMNTNYKSKYLDLKFLVLAKVDWEVIRLVKIMSILFYYFLCCRMKYLTLLPRCSFLFLLRIFS